VTVDLLLFDLKDGTYCDLRKSTLPTFSPTKKGLLAGTPSRTPTPQRANQNIKTMATYTCSLSGLPATKAVVTPSGHICSFSLLLTKLSENGGIDPFDPDAKRSLDESDLIHLADNTNASSQILPPRPPSTTSLPSILTILQQEFDAVLLELYDTRKALEETRRELSTALYQNDAAVRVIARVCAERDELKNSRYQHQDQMQGQQQGEKRTRDEKDEEEVQPSKKKKGDGIPLEDMQAMTTTWTQLNAARKPIAKLKRSPEEIASIEDKLKSLGEKKVNVHKSNSNGVLGLQCVVNTKMENKEDYVVSIGKDGQIVVYNVSTGVIAHTVSCAGVERAHAVSTSEDGILICASTVNKEVKLYVLQEEEVKLVSSREVDSEIVGIAIHPSSTLDAVRIVVATASDILLVKSSSSGGEMEVLTKLEDSAGNNVKYTAGELHPDGFIYAHGTEVGKLVIWDLKTQSLAMTLDVSCFFTVSVVLR
jgi:pre-mRNA-processing factor 19